MSEQTKAEADVREALMAMMAAYNTGDVDAFLNYYHPAVTGFFAHGRVLEEGLSRAGMQALYDAGFKPTLQARQLAVKVYGDAALVTLYVCGNIRWPDGRVESGTWRQSQMLVKQDGAWKCVHYHISLLTAEYSISKP